MGGRVDSAAHATALSKIQSISKYAPDLRLHLEQILDGPAFKGSHRSQIFLKHIVERSLNHEFDSLRERSIGVELFRRPAAYDTGEDAVVRVAASDVRKRLMQHYATNGADSRFRIEIPTGSYLPDFRCMEMVDAAPSDAEVVPPAVQPAELPVEPQSLPAKMAPTFILRRRSALSAALLLIAAGAIAGALIGGRLAKTPPPRADLISGMFEGAPGAIQVIVSDEALVLAQVMLRRSCTLQEYEDLTCLNAPEVEQGEMRRLFHSLATRQIANIGDLQNAVRIDENLRARNWEVNIRHARQVHARDFRNGNFIILGGSFGNPWAGLFQIPNANFPLEEPRPAGRVPAYLNPHPRAGEPPSFGVQKSDSGGKTITHARIALVENMSHTGRVLLVAGQSVSATELAADFLFHAESAAQARRILGLSAKSRFPDLEMILRVSEVNQVGDGVELVACRKLDHRTD